jgi:cell division protein ZipA
MEGMELGIRGWMIIIGVLLILAVLLDGYRRIRSDRNANIRVALKTSPITDGDDVELAFGSELPNGGARVVARTGQQGGGSEAGEAVALESQGSDRQGYQHDGETADEILGLKPLPESSVEIDFARKEALESFTAHDYDIPEDLSDARGSVFRSESSPSAGGSSDDGSDDGSNDRAGNGIDAQASSALKKSGSQYNNVLDEIQRAPEQAATLPEHVEEVVAVKVMAKKGRVLAGEDLLRILLACDCRFGAMNVFHRYEEANAEGPVQFSVANVVEPGVFHIDDIKHFSTPGVVFFVQLPGPSDALQAYDYMIETAQCVANNLSGELRDETHSVMTIQTLEHNRQRVAEFERRSLVK